MSFDLWGIAEHNAMVNGGEIDAEDPLAPMRAKGGVNLAGAAGPAMKAHKPSGRPAAARSNQPAHGGGFTPFASPMLNPGILSPDQQADHLQGMANGIMRAYQDENDSRIAQARELLRMEHEKEMEDKANEADLAKEAMRRDALLARLGGWTKRVWDPQAHDWRYIQ